jgi:hypothetical protein
MSTLKVKNIQHPDASEPAISFSAAGELVFAEPPVENLNDIVDVDIDTPSSGDALVFDGEDWVNQALSTDDLAEGSNEYYTDAKVDARISAASIDDLSDAATSGAETGDALVFDGEDWVPNASTYQKLSEKNSANGYAGLDGAGKLNASAIPALAITDTFVVANQSGRLALSAQTGDVAVQTDENKTFILEGADPSNNADWVQILTPEPFIPTQIDDLSDVSAAEPSSGNFLKFTGQSWNPSTPSLNDLNDVSTSGVQDGQALVYNSSAQSWTPGSAGSAGESAISESSVIAMRMFS